jgi:hypothetical protein
MELVVETRDLIRHSFEPSRKVMHPPELGQDRVAAQATTVTNRLLDLEQQVGREVERGRRLDKRLGQQVFASEGRGTDSLLTFA